MSAIELTPEILALLDVIVDETKLNWGSQPLSVADACPERHTTAQRDFITENAYQLAKAIRRQQGET